MTFDRTIGASAAGALPKRRSAPGRRSAIGALAELAPELDEGQVGHPAIRMVIVGRFRMARQAIVHRQDGADARIAHRGQIPWFPVRTRATCEPVGDEPEDVFHVWSLPCYASIVEKTCRRACRKRGHGVKCIVDRPRVATVRVIPVPRGAARRRRPSNRRRRDQGRARELGEGWLFSWHLGCRWKQVDPHGLTPHDALRVLAPGIGLVLARRGRASPTSDRAPAPRTPAWRCPRSGPRAG